MTIQGGATPVAAAPVNPGVKLTTTNTTMNLYQKILEVMKEVQYLQKDGQVAFGSTKYRFLSEAKITQNIRQACITRGLVILPVDCVAERFGVVSQVTMKYKIVDAATGEFEILSAVGHGADGQDKGAPKAMTGAFKYMQRQAFMLPTGDDPDNICSEELAEDPNMKKIQPEQITEISNLKKALNWDKDQTKTFAEQVCSTGDMSNYSMAMGIRLIAAMKTQLVSQQPQQTQ